jgi:hypothetical protein
MSDTPHTDCAYKGDLSVGLMPEIVTWEDSLEFSRAMEKNRDAFRAVANELAKCVKCPNCDDIGWYVGPSEKDPMEPAQVNCQFCHTVPNSRYKALMALADLQPGTC